MLGNPKPAVQIPRRYPCIHCSQTGGQWHGRAGVEPWGHIHSVCEGLRGLRTSVAVPELSPSHAAGPTPIKVQITKVISLSLKSYSCCRGYSISLRHTRHTCCLYLHGGEGTEGKQQRFIKSQTQTSDRDSTGCPERPRVLHQQAASVSRRLIHLRNKKRCQVNREQSYHQFF